MILFDRGTGVLVSSVHSAQKINKWKMKIVGSVDYQESLNKSDPSEPSLILVFLICKKKLNFQLFDLDVDNSFTRGVLAKFLSSL